MAAPDVPQADALDRLYGDMVLFSIPDTPVMVALNKYREEAYIENDGHQTVTGVFGRRDEYG